MAPGPASTNADEALRAAALEAAGRAHAPYSRFRVGAALRTADGRVFTGCNVENASYGLTLCAERMTLASAIAAGATDFERMAVECIDARPELGLEGRMPCGACRQWLLELAPDAEVLVSAPEGPRAFRVRELLPHGFRLGEVGERAGREAGVRTRPGG
ncbi:MAG: cytidine deaminase [Verrucomicrobiota bacterium]